MKTAFIQLVVITALLKLSMTIEESFGYALMIASATAFFREHSKEYLKEVKK